MFKKSHISLARYIVDNMDVQDMQEHKKAFYLGSILPDCMPSFLVRKHRMDETFDVLKKEMKKVVEDYDVDKGIGTYFCRHLGVITHYLADYFTFTHNEHFTGTVKEHLAYEKKLKREFREYVQSDEAKQNRVQTERFRGIDDLCEYIKNVHNEYLCAISKIKRDCRYIVSLVYRVIDAILQFFERKTAAVRTA